MSTVLMIVLTLLYPLAIWFGQGQFEPRFLAALLLLLALTRLHVLKSTTRPAIGGWAECWCF